MGFGAFNARRSAKNFTDEEFASAVDYCRLRGVRVFLTLNTLLTDRELDKAADTLRKASAMGVDAVLVQDWGVLTLARVTVPDLPIHASTQMSLFTLGGAREAEKLGMERVVLARELSRDEVAEICAGCGAEIEIFGHGALYVLLRPVRDERRAGRAQRQPRALRPALPAALRRKRALRRGLSPESEGRQPVRLFAGHGAHGRSVPEDRGPDEAARIRGGGDGHLPPAAGREAPPHGGGERRAGAGILPQRLYRRLLAGPQRGGPCSARGRRTPRSRRGAVCPGPGGIRKRKKRTERSR